jgi:molybdopterin synthase sulfur carrier subunit
MLELMGIKFKIPKRLQEKADGAVHVEVQGGSVQACIADLIRRYPGLEGMILDRENRILLRWMVYINNQSAVASNELSYQVKDGDIITLLPMVAGG